MRFIKPQSWKNRLNFYFISHDSAMIRTGQGVQNRKDTNDYKNVTYQDGELVSVL